MGRLTLPLVLLSALTLAACGVKGPLEPPPGAPDASSNARQGQNAQAGSASVSNWNDQAKSLERMPSGNNTPGTTFGWGGSDREAEKDHLRGAYSPDRPFILDGLL
ncbi:LPS translocon maturation chaperone LptM [Xanthobacter sp. TB0136]|uniref:LPS translocon maturation chaperone LptM n=1 Tax=Xanthobacter sp. TB0136 TaxID=3459177 RepID=UPI00403A5340